jgi:putative FmdB family regulatory protein
VPTYSYKCPDCGTAFDIQQAFTDDSLTVCPNCGGNLRKVFSAVGVSFNGSGFYRNDSRAGGDGKPGGKSGAGSSEPSSSSSESKSSESKASDSKSSGSQSSDSKSSSSSPSGDSGSKPASTTKAPAASPTKAAG